MLLLRLLACCAPSVLLLPLPACLVPRAYCCCWVRMCCCCAYTESMCVGPAQLHAREGGSTVRIPVLTPATHTPPWETKPSGAGVSGSAIFGCWATLAFCMRVCTLTRGCSAIWTLIVNYVHVRLLELARMTEIGSVGWVCAALACPRVKAHGEQHLLQHTKTR